MNFVNVSLSAIGVLLGFSLASLITVLMDWMKNNTPNVPSGDDKKEINSDLIIDNTSSNEISMKKRFVIMKKKCRNCFQRLIHPFTYIESQNSLCEIINILKIVSSLFIIVFWTLIVLYIQQSDEVIFIENPFIYITTVLPFYLFPIIGLELLLLLIFKIKMNSDVLFTKSSNIVVLFSMGYIIAFLLLWKS